MADTGFRLSLERRVRSQTGLHVATAAALSTRRHATARSAMRFWLDLEQRVRSQMGSHVATAAARSTTRSRVTATLFPAVMYAAVRVPADTGFGLRLEQPV